MLKLLFPMMLLLLSRSSRWLPSPISLMMISILMFKLFVPSSPTYEASFLFSSDRLATPLIILSLWMTALMFFASTTTLNTFNHIKPFSSTITILCLVLAFAFATNNLMIFYMLFETSLLPTALLIITWGYQPERLQASMYMMIYMITASFPLLAIFTSIYLYNHHMNMHPMMLYPAITNMTLWWLSTIFAFMVKLPLYTLHLWLPKAHVEAPIAGSMILAGLLLKLGAYGLMRLTFLFPMPSLSLSSPLTILTLWGASLTGLSCLQQTDLKALIAYSSVAHMGLFLAAVTSMTSLGWTGALITMLAHGLISPMLFVLANLSYQTVSSRSLFLTKGMMSFLPPITFWWFLTSAANMSAPPSINLLGEILMLTSVLSLTSSLAILLMILTFLTAAYSLHAYTNTQHGPPPSFLSGLFLPSQMNHSLLLFHLYPALLLIAQPTFISLLLAL